MLRLLFAATLGALAVTPIPAAENNSTQPATRSAVLCTWQTYVSLKAIGERCFAKRDKVFIGALDEAIGRMDDYLLKKSKMTSQQLEADKRKLEEQASSALAVDAAGRCDPHKGNINFYNVVPRMTRPEKTRAHIDELLAADPPAADPCF